MALGSNVIARDIAYLTFVVSIAYNSANSCSMGKVCQKLSFGDSRAQYAPIVHTFSAANLQKNRNRGMFAAKKWTKNHGQPDNLSFEEAFCGN